MISSIEQAVELLNRSDVDSVQREMAAHYLAQHPDPSTVRRLVDALGDNDSGVRWAAAEALAKLGEIALPDMLGVLLNHEYAGNPLVREGIYHALYHNNSPRVAAMTSQLMKALIGPVADLASMVEAYQLLRRMRHADDGMTGTNSPYEPGA